MSFTAYCNCGKSCPMVLSNFSHCVVDGFFEVDFTGVSCCIVGCIEPAIECRFYPRENGKSYPVCVKHAEENTLFCAKCLTVASKGGGKTICFRCGNI